MRLLSTKHVSWFKGLRCAPPPIRHPLTWWQYRRACVICSPVATFRSSPRYRRPLPPITGSSLPRYLLCIFNHNRMEVVKFEVLVIHLTKNGRMYEHFLEQTKAELFPSSFSTSTKEIDIFSMSLMWERNLFLVSRHNLAFVSSVIWVFKSSHKLRGLFFIFPFVEALADAI